MVRNNLDYNPTGGEIFIFTNKRRDKIKLLHWQGSGYLLYHKRLKNMTEEQLLDRYKLQEAIIKEKEVILEEKQVAVKEKKTAIDKMQSLINHM